MTDTFLQSMTFAKPEEFLGSCDCDECDNMPESIRKFLHEKKRERIIAVPIKRTQQRTSIGRHGRISLWCMHMPKNAEPLVEFGSSHRIVWIKKLGASLNTSNNDSSILRWIGKGIIGSSDEEKSRKNMIEWTEGNVFLVPSNGGKAVGWIYADNDSEGAINTANNNEGDGIIDNFAVMNVAKIPLDIDDKDLLASGKSDFHWSDQLIKYCQKGLQSLEKRDEKIQSYYRFPDEISEILKKCFREAENMKAKSMTVNNDAIEQASKKLRLNK